MTNADDVTQLLRTHKNLSFNIKIIILGLGIWNILKEELI